LNRARLLALPLALLAAFAAVDPVSPAGAPAPSSTPVDAAAALAEIAASALDLAAARPVKSLKLAIDLADVWLDEGWLVPARPVSGRSAELVFVGEGRIKVPPPDEIEAGQLELFTGQRAIDQSFDRAVLVIASDPVIDRVLRASPGQPPAEVARSAEERWKAWRASAERRHLGVETGLLADALGDPGSSSYFFAWIERPDDHPFFVMIDPPSFEQVTIGQFVPLELDEDEERKTARELRSQQRRGRLLGLETGDLGDIDQWMSATMGSRGGTKIAARAAFEPQKYVLDATISGSGDLTLAGRARLTLDPAYAGARVVRATLHPDLELKSVRDADSGAALPHRRQGASIAIALPTPAVPGQTVTLDIAYEGHFLDKLTRSIYALRDTLAWYPHVGDADRATYDMTVRWPKRLEMFGAGRRVEGGEGKDGMPWERRLIEVPTAGATFELGKYVIERAQAGHVAIEVAFDAESEEMSKKSRDEIVAALRDSLLFYEETFGPYPLDSLRAVTVPRFFSQGLLGFVSLSSLGVADQEGFLALLFGFADRRTLIAHEVAHQWWGNQVGEQSYRDAWLSEAFAEYSAALFARKKLTGKERVRFGRTSGWKGSLLSTTDQGRTVESLGPIVLGARLASSKHNAYQEIVYTKGAVVLEMLSRLWAPDDFPKVLREIVRVGKGRSFSTADVVSLFSKISGTDLEPFASQYIYGTGMPEVNYDWSIEARPNGKFAVALTGEQHASYHFRYRVEKAAGGRFQLAREAVADHDARSSALVVPFQIEIELSDEEYAAMARDQKKPIETAKEKKERKKKSGGKSTGTATGSLSFRGDRLSTAIEVDKRPLEFWLDRDETVFGHFLDARRQPKLVAFRRATAALARGDRAEADRLFARALESAVRVTVGDDDEPDASETKHEGDFLDARIHLGLAESAIGAGDLARAERERQAAKRLLDGHHEDYLESDFVMLEARLDLARGEDRKAFRALRKAVLKRSSVDETEAWLLLALSALEAGELDECQEALEVVREREADVALLTAALAEKKKHSG
jgi:hypothetical protein